MVGIGEYTELFDNPDNNFFRINTKYNSIIRYYDDLVSGLLLGVVPYDVVVSKNITSCRYINEYGQEILLIASIKNRTYDTATV